MTAVDRVLAGGGEAGALARTIDWGATPIGAVETWSPSLRAAASLVLNCHSGMLLWWGPRFVQLYNDAYIPVLGDKHPRAMGQPFAECWREVFHILGPMAERPFRGGPASVSDNIELLLERNVPREEAHFRIAYSPVLDDTVPGTGIGGVLATVTETTLQCYDERQLRTLRQLAERNLAAGASADDACHASAEVIATNPSDVPFALLYLLDDAGRSARLVARVGFAPGATAAPDEVALDGACIWPLRRVVTDRAAVTVPLAALADALPRTPWDSAPEQAIALPLVAADRSRAYGVLVCGVSPHRRLDVGYRGFFDLVAAQVSTAIGTARAFDEERRRAAALAEFDRAKTAFFSNVSHEFRTPLTLLLSPMEEALSTGGALAGEELFVGYRNAIRLQKLVNQLLDFARIEAKRAEPRYQATDLAAFTADLASAFRSAIERGGLRLEVDCPPLAGPVLVDPEMWEKVVLNLLSNAFKFTFEGSIRVELHDRDGSVVLRIRDTGTGIAREYLPRLFERFRRVEGARARSHEGSGIGLALVADLVRLLGGTIEVASEVGTGTEITVMLPRRDAGHVAAAAVTTGGAHRAAFVDEAMQWVPGQRPEAPAPEHAPGGPRIVLADDNADMRAYVARLLGARWTVIQVSDGAAALAEVRRDPPDLVIADVMMPSVDGFGLVHELRADPQTRAIPIVLLSARAGDEAIADGLRSGADDYIVKPFSASQLVVRVETQLVRSRMRSAALGERRRLYTALMNAPAPFVLLEGADLVVEFVNHAALDAIGHGPEIVGRPLLEAAPELAAQPFPRMLAEVRRTGRARSGKGVSVKLGTNGDGAPVERSFDFVFEPIVDATGAVTAVLAFAVDVTQQLTAQRTVEAALDEARSANKAKDEFLALLGHELRNPMAPILTAVELMKARGDQNVTREREVIERQSVHLVRLVDDLLDVSRISRGTVDLNRVRIAVADLMAKSIEIAEPLFAQRNHAIDVAIARDIRVDADPARMTQVFSNLLTNAAKYTPPGGRITVRGWQEDDTAVISVRDNGVGIAPDVLPHVFEMFVQERQGPDRARGGLGLGLAIVRALVRRHGGEVEARSAGRGEGSELLVRLPIAQELPATAEPGPAAPVIPVAAAPGRILIVDDNADAAHLLADAVASMGHEARVVHDGPSALRVAETFAPDVALLDIGLPVMDGYEVAMHLRAKSRVHLVAVSGYGQPGDREQSMRAGFEAHMVKPVDIGRLAATLEQLIAQR